VERVRRYPVEAAVVATHFLGGTAVFVLGEEALLLVRGEDRLPVRVHGGAILAATADGERVLTGGDDGKVAATDAAGVSATLAVDGKHRWIDHVAGGPDGAVAWSAGKQAFVRLATGAERVLEAPSTVGALAFAPKGLRLAVAHYNGASLWFPNAAKAEPERLEWKGSHLAKWLASSGSSQVVLWPFQSKTGPMGKSPRVLAPADAILEVVACHPKEAVVATGYANGLILLVRIDDGAEILARQPADAPVTALAWNESGTLLAFGTEDGDAGVVDLA
jgi:hypothetical protein